MKKVLVLVLALVMVVSTSLTAFAAGGFVSSPSGNKAPRLVSFTVKPEGCGAQLVVDAYADRDQLSAEGKSEIEDAYAQIKGAADLTKLAAGLADLGVSADDLAVSDLFDISVAGCTCEEGKHESYVITLESDTFVNFAGILHFVDGKAELVNGAAADGKQITFEVNSLSPFAVVVNTNPGSTNPPPTGDKTPVWMWAVLTVVSGVALAVCVIKSKKQEA